MWLAKFLDIISNLLHPDPISGHEDAIARLNPDKIYVENVRSLLDVSYKRAVGICETAVRQGLFKRGVEVLCPDGSVGFSAKREEDIPLTINCWAQEDGVYEEKLIPTNTLQKIMFYQLDDQQKSTVV